MDHSELFDPGFLARLGAFARLTARAFGLSETDAGHAVRRFLLRLSRSRQAMSELGSELEARQQVCAEILTILHRETPESSLSTSLETLRQVQATAAALFVTLTAE